jgi:hypothetical protein
MLLIINTVYCSGVSKMASGIPPVGAPSASLSSGDEQTLSNALADMIGTGLVSQQMLFDSVFDPTKELLNEAYSD